MAAFLRVGEQRIPSESKLGRWLRATPAASLAVAVAWLSTSALALDNGLAVTPPRGWRSWNSYDCTEPLKIITDAAMRGAMHAMLDRSRSVGGKPTSLQDLGFGWVSMDDGWQQCNCSTQQDLDPTLPTCSVGDCMGGKCTWHNRDTGFPMVNVHRFSDMKSLVTYGHSLGLKVGSYLNNCICMEAGQSPTHIPQDVAWFLDAGFDEVKIDNCGSSGNVSHFVELFNASGKPVRIENCHNGVPDPATGFCPMNMYRSGGDIDAGFDSILGEAYSTVVYNDRPDPQSRPGCWAYPDMLEIGNNNGPEPVRSHEERSHFGIWCIVSAPLILGFNMSDAATMDRVWPTITNTDALSVNEQWAGHPGTLVKSYPAQDVPAFQAGQGPCDGAPRSLGWQLINGSLRAAGSTDELPLCLDGAMPLPYEPNVYAYYCPPPTTGSGQVNCGNPIRPCNETRGRWAYDVSGLLMWYPPQGERAYCLRVTLPAFSQYTDPAARSVGEESRPVLGLRVGDGRRQQAVTMLSDCPSPHDVPPTSDIFTFTQQGELRNGAEDGLCIINAPLNGVQLWSKPLLAEQGKPKVAVLLVNVLSIPQALRFPLADVPGITPGTCPDGYVTRDVWAQETATYRDHLNVSLASHESAFYIFSCAATKEYVTVSVI